ncbi:alpha/beta hydrolase [Actinocrinis sp.]|uniref:alpha/beta fold hydrolase n=1 Tax=Actinocrinis sp. TaxID=1920516 RepID=UPI0032C23184
MARLRYRTIHGHKHAFRMAGNGPAVLLIHGIGDSSETWAPIVPGLARNHRVIVPDLLGHGESDKPRGDYSIGGYANGMRDLLSVLGIDRVTLVGHSLGGGVAMQFAYQYPERTERIVLVATGGVGRQVTPLLRAASLPGAELLMAAMKLPTVRLQITAAVKLLQLSGLPLGRDAPELLRVLDALPNADSRLAFGRTLRAVLDWRGQLGTLLDRCYLTEGMPTMLMWGAKDPILPASHAWLAHVAMPGSRLELFTDTGHFPFHTQPQRFLDILLDFIATTEAAGFSAEEWRQMLRNRKVKPRPASSPAPAPTAAQAAQAPQDATAPPADAICVAAA